LRSDRPVSRIVRSGKQVLQCPKKLIHGKEAEMEKELIVIGGGIAGLGCAALLAKEGMKVLMIEKSSFLEGRNFLQIFKTSSE
jgi:heterodisulfide reductase subunit A-like polyferredoxin